MRRRPLARFALVAALAAGAASCVAPSRPRTETPEPPLAPEAFDENPGPARPPESTGPPAPLDSLVEAHNARRSRAGLPPLFENPTLDAAAEGHARDMADRRKMAHRGGDGSSPFDRIARQGYEFRAAGENVAYGFDDVESVMDGWMRSPGHRRNILGAQYSEIGVGRAVAKDGASYWCVTFGTPRTR